LPFRGRERLRVNKKEKGTRQVLPYPIPFNFIAL